MKMKRTKSLQPWLDYFDMLKRYEKSGLLEVMPEDHEAYMTRAALHTIAPDGDLQKQSGKNILKIVRYIRTYAAFISSEPGLGYCNQPFAIHVVKEEAPHDLLCTILLKRHRSWFSLWRKTDSIEVITYGHEEKNHTNSSILL